MIRAALTCALLATSLGGCSVASFLASDARPLPQGGPVVDEILGPDLALAPRARRVTRIFAQATEPAATLRQAERERLAWLRENARAPAVLERIEALAADRPPRLPATEPAATGSTGLPPR